MQYLVDAYKNCQGKQWHWIGYPTTQVSEIENICSEKERRRGKA